MNKRTVSIIRELCDLEKVIDISELARQFEVSQRTIRNDLNVINDILKEQGLAGLELEKGGKITRGREFREVLNAISEKDFYDYKLSKEERKKIASALLVSSSGYITLSAIAEYLFVSRATVINDLDEIKAFIKKGNLEVLSHPNKGLRVEGNESDKRVFLMQLGNVNFEHAEQDMVIRQISVDEGTRMIFQKLLFEQEHVHKCFLNDDSFQKILLYLGIMLNRNKQGEYIEVRIREQNSKYQMAKDILMYISQYCHNSTTEDEVCFLSELLSLAGYMKQKLFDRNAVKVQLVSRKFIECVSEELGVNLNRDFDFFENLSNHLESVFSAAHMEYTENPVISEVLEENQEVVRAVRKELSVIRQYAGREISETEMGYIAVHVCAAIERKKNKEISFHVIVACHAGIGTSRLLLEKLKKHFNFQIVDIISSHEARGLKAGEADFIISTVPLEGCCIDSIIVSPLLSDADYIRVGNMVDTLRSTRNLPAREEKKKMTARGLLDKLIPVVYDAVPEEASRLLKEINRVVSEYFDQPVASDDEVFSPSLSQLLPDTHIQLDVECANWRQAVMRSAENLLRLGYIEERYIDAMIENVEENGPYIVIAKGFAVPHEGTDRGSIKVGMNLIRLKTPVEFGDEEKDPVEFLCCLSAEDHKTHLKAFFNLVNMLRNEEFKEELRKCATSEEAAAVIEKYENLS